MSKSAFHLQAAILDDFAHMEDLSKDPDGVNIVLSAIKHRDDLADYFFSKAPSPQWASLLYEQGFFSSPPEPEKVESGYRVPGWRLSQYLANVAASVPDLVIKVVNTIETKNANICVDLVQALARIPAHLVPQALEKVILWIRSDLVGWGFPADVFDLVTYLANNGEVDSSLQIFQVLTEPLTPSSNQRLLSQEARSRFDEFRSIERFWLQPLLLLGSKAPRQLIEIIEGHLNRAVGLENIARGRDANADDEFWRSAIEDSDQDSFNRDYKSELLVALRVSLENWVSTGSEDGLDYVRGILAGRRSSFRRLGIYIVRLHPRLFEPELRMLIMSAGNLDDVPIHHEFLQLLAAGFPFLEKADQELVIANITRGPDRSSVHKLAVWAQKERGANIEQYEKSYINGWILDRLWMIREHLPDSERARLTGLVGELGEPKHPDFLVWSTRAFTVHDRSPLSSEELAQMSAQQILDFIRSWQPVNLFHEEPDILSHEGLANTIADLALSQMRPEGLIAGLISAPPMYANKIYLRLEEEIKKGMETPWSEALSLADSIVTLHSTIGEKEYLAWRNARVQIASLLETALQNDQVVLPTAILQQMRDILLRLIYDPDPDEQSDNPPDGYLGHGDPLAIALNHARPRALMALMEYARRWANLQVPGPNSDAAGDFRRRWESVVREAVTDKLDRSKDPSWSVHTVYGLYLPLLFWLDRSWLDEHLERILPEGHDESSRYAAAAWDSYVLNSPGPEMMDYLRKEYVRAILGLDKETGKRIGPDPTKHLAAHVMSEYLHTDYDLLAPPGENNLLRLFMDQASTRAREDAIWILWRWLEDNPTLRKEKWKKVRALWSWRTQEASIRGFPADFNGEFEWFARFPELARGIEEITTLWPLLQGLVPYVTRNEARGGGWLAVENYLAAEVDRDPVSAIKLYRLMHEQPTTPKWLRYGDEAEKILRGALGSPAAVEDVVGLIDLLARRGVWKFVDLVKNQ